LITASRIAADFGEISANHLDFYHKHVKTVRRNLTMSARPRHAAESNQYLEIRNPDQ
jgi:hypothetical protein